MCAHYISAAISSQRCRFDRSHLDRQEDSLHGGSVRAKLAVAVSKTELQTICCKYHYVGVQLYASVIRWAKIVGTGMYSGQWCPSRR
jgi:hypothetical protein